MGKVPKFNQPQQRTIKELAKKRWTVESGHCKGTDIFLYLERRTTIITMDRFEWKQILLSSRGVIQSQKDDPIFDTYLED